MIIAKRTTMSNRLPLALSATAAVLVLLGTDPLGNAVRGFAASVVPRASKAGYAARAGTAANAGALNGHHSSSGFVAGVVPVVPTSGRFPVAIGPQGSAGPAGASGTGGDKGPTGSAGPAGQNSVSGYTTVTSIVSPPAYQQSSTGMATCPSGTYVVGGGSYGTAAFYRTVASSPASGLTGWTVTYYRFANDAFPGNTNVWALCASVSIVQRLIVVPPYPVTRLHP